MAELERLSPEAFRRAEKTPVVLVLDNVRSALNVGSAFRTADAFALAEIYLCGITAQPPHREILKTALGATDTVSWRYVPDTLTAVTELRERGHTIYAVEQAADSLLLQDLPPTLPEPVALVFGNEVKGVSDAVMEQVDGAIEIPQFGTKHSLNISVCLGIVA
jgi:tRNA G18 (ribose-2'-O)-methylase SpoU